MWTLKVKGFEKDNLFNSQAIKHKVSIHYYPLSHYLKNDFYYFTAVGIVEGNEKNVRAFFNDLKKENKKSKTKRYVVKLEINGNFYVCVSAQHKSVEAEKFVHLYYDPKIIHIDPAVIDSKGYETWNIAVMEKKDLEEPLRIGERKYNARISSLKETKLKNIGILSVLPEITERQKEAFLLAYENGYYEYPRQIELEKLAKKMNLALSTYQAHLRKAEKSFLGFIARKYF
jgi:predicted DNA binding protein